jgi:hypothetical protein
MPLEDTISFCPSDLLQSGSKVSLQAVVRSHVQNAWWRTISIESLCSALGTWSSVSRADFSESATTLFWKWLQPSHILGILTEPCLQPSRVFYNV